MSRVLVTLEGVPVYQDDDGHVHFVAGARIDADGANGQDGAAPAYMVGDKGLEALANGGMGMRGGKVIGTTDWFDDIVILGADGQPKVLNGGVIASRTSYRHRGLRHDDPAAYVDAATVPYIVVSPRIRNRARGIVLGCKARVTNTRNGCSVDAVVADIGPAAKIGELSIAAAEALGIPSNPRHGGCEERNFLYECWPGTPATLRVNGKAMKFELMAA